MDTDELTQPIPTEVVAELVSIAWQTFVGVELVPTDPTDAPMPTELISASISISGPWSATVIISVSRAAAFAGTATVLGMTADDVVEDDVRDIVGELANIVGGNIKGFVSDSDHDWSLSLPVVSSGVQSVPGSRLVSECTFDCDGELIACQVREHR